MLYIHTGSPSVTSLTYNNQSRTLTCTSTGGPATTVTWRRNGVMITLGATYHQTKRLVDPVNGTYRTVLTIDSSVGPSGFVGSYNCTVENIRGTSSKSGICRWDYHYSLSILLESIPVFLVLGTCRFYLVDWRYYVHGQSVPGLPLGGLGTRLSMCCWMLLSNQIFEFE